MPYRLLRGNDIEAWNQWRREHDDVPIDLVEANLSGADLRGAMLWGADLFDADLSGAELSGADLSGAMLWGAKLTGANLRGAKLTGTYLRDAELRNAELTGAELSGADMRGASLSGAELSGAELSGAELSGAELSGAELSGAVLFPMDEDASSLKEEVLTTLPALLYWLPELFNILDKIFLAAATLASIIQGIDVVLKRWSDHNAKSSQTLAIPPSTNLSTVSDSSEIESIYLVMTDNSRHSFKRWMSDPEELKRYIEDWNVPTSPVKPLLVTFVRKEGDSLAVNVTEGASNNRQLNAILRYLGK